MATLFAGCKKDDDDEISPDILNNGVTTVWSDDSSMIISVVDMGRNICWATCNIGSNSPEQPGQYFAWAETNHQKKEYTRNSYKWFNNGGIADITKYCTLEGYAYHKQVDNVTVIQPSDDPATVFYGAKWQTPSSTQFRELIKRCTRTWGTVNGAWGCLLTSNDNGNSVFFPVSGVFDGNKITHSSIGFYWTRDLNASSPNKAYSLWVRCDGDLSDIEVTDTDRERGLQVRAIIKTKDIKK
ncbi:MAG: hypothetical protein IKZ89_10845 [Bacteroidaceae bacterium]|nr:hypothetical protein [Bacteroidaceae bacterium]